MKDYPFHCDHCGRNATLHPGGARFTFHHQCPGPVTVGSGENLPKDSRWRISVLWKYFACRHTGPTDCTMCHRPGYRPGHITNRSAT